MSRPLFSLDASLLAAEGAAMVAAGLMLPSPIAPLATTWAAEGGNGGGYGVGCCAGSGGAGDSGGEWLRLGSCLASASLSLLLARPTSRPSMA